MASSDNTRTTKPTLLQITWSVVASFCGIQNSQNHDRDDEHIEQVGFKPYIVIGVVITLLIVAFVYGLVQLALKLA
jgi:prepilin signal peptidase PulO-like enzyme (type II secretory pathway)